MTLWCEGGSRYGISSEDADGHSAAELRRLANVSKDANQSRRPLSLAAVFGGINREDAARVGGMDRQTLRDWAHRFKAAPL
ncbi:hypothetical protein MES5069_460016 [Mesorhizobium escarrei]|uniref:Helix-turn-helix domain-containing protein n=1 Tax=Mesorhizobium escarrei TaxID=666018 RepID=A0ABN8K6J3_9HYPH|nr:hypothetical protein MES5069_460016 [Mesorhizobium escarrei]